MLLIRRGIAASSSRARIFTIPFAAPSNHHLRLLTMSSTTAPFTRLVRFHPSSDPSTIKIGTPVDPTIDIGLSTFPSTSSTPPLIDVYSGTSVLSPGTSTGERLPLGTILSPLTPSEVGTIRCIGLNYTEHAHEANLPIPTVPTLFMKPSTSLAGPYPQPTVIPKNFVADDAADYEAELAVIIGKPCKDVDEQHALDYVLGITAANDVSSRTAQFAQSQWSYSKGFDSACPIGPTIVHISTITNLRDVQIQAKLNDKVVQNSSLNDLIFSIPKIISFLSQGTTLPPGTIILTGTPAGIGWTANPRRTLQHGDTFSVTISNGVGTLINQIQYES
ncbi:putative mitochondrial hydrolase FMP41 (putative) [Pseudozyma hubeiensis]|nr:putative mitochondrial hydrolase FMP41 (putative) [Pseudozyma hubeiensis]